MKRIICITLALSIFLCGCSVIPSIGEKKQYTATFLTLFDTVTTIVGQADSEREFQAKAQSIHDNLQKYHQLFDIYNEYDGINNLKTVTDQAGVAPVVVDRIIIDLLLDCKTYYNATNGKVNVAMGSVLQLWHDARSDSIDDPVHAYLPDHQELENANAHISIDAIVIDETASTVYISDANVRLDVGAIAKGWSVQKVAELAPTGLLISVGGNVFATGPKDISGTPWVVGIQNPNDGNEYLHTIYVAGGSVVTSGDYQRFFVVDGKPYHHIIDPDTLSPSTHWRSVTIVCADSGLADALSTALFLLPQPEGQQLLSQFDAEAMWVDANGNILYSPGFEALIRT